ncbi:hypothetical protein BKA81DRAFT_369650 [Phyllosticta paracitricarpa]
MTVSSAGCCAAVGVFCFIFIPCLRLCECAALHQTENITASAAHAACPLWPLAQKRNATSFHQASAVQECH